MKTKFYWVALLASAALIAQAQGGGYHGGGGTPHFGGGQHFGGGTPHFGGRGRFGGGIPHFGGGTRFSPSGARQSQLRPLAFAGPNRRFAGQSAPAATTFNRRPGQFGSTARQHATVSGARAPRSSSRQALNGKSGVFARHDGNWHRNWDRGHDHFWRGHRCRFLNGEWIIFDTGFYADDYYGYGYPYGYYPDDYYTESYSGADPNYYDEGAYASSSSDQSTDSTVVAVQEQLTRQGYYRGEIDGIFGQETRRGLLRYQSDHGLRGTGRLDVNTLHALGLPRAASN